MKSSRRFRLVASLARLTMRLRDSVESDNPSFFSKGPDDVPLITSVMRDMPPTIPKSLVVRLSASTLSSSAASSKSSVTKVSRARARVMPTAPRNPPQLEKKHSFQLVPRPMRLLRGKTPNRSRKRMAFTKRYSITMYTQSIGSHSSRWRISPNTIPPRAKMTVLSRCSNNAQKPFMTFQSAINPPPILLVTKPQTTTAMTPLMPLTTSAV
mmetsp:Transcript_30376/g.61925  ORF Transcript_30376/g.61925 Transcript_30376/m.61925 type:complete len:211 (+) Transcript_30376:1488-2120(+)